MQTNWGSLWQPTLLSLFLTITSFVLGFAIAMPIGLVRAYGPVILRKSGRRKSISIPRQEARRSDGATHGGQMHHRSSLAKALVAPAYGVATGYVEGIRGTPFYVQMYLIFYFSTFAWAKLPQLFIIVGLLALTVSTVGYQAEVFRAAFQSVGQGQIEAAKAMGMRGRQVFWHVTLPQGLRLVVLPLTNEWIGLFKVTSILSFIAIEELLFQAYHLGSILAHPIEAFIMVSIVYLIILIPLSRIVTYVERRKRIPGLGTPIVMPARGRA